MNYTFAKDLTVTEITSRLPGPLAGSLFVEKGFQVNRIEWLDRPDAFKEGEVSDINPLFKDWYQSINHGKNIVELAISDLHNDHEELKRILQHTDILLLAVSKKEKDLILSLIEDSVKVVTELVASEKEHKFLHDLNALAQVGILNFSTELALPPLPIGGIVFSAKIFSDSLCALLEYQYSQKTQFVTSGLEEAISSYLEKLLPSSDDNFHALHNGKFPCYKIYKLKDQKMVAIAAIEEHFWQRILSHLELNPALDRFDLTGNTFEILINKFAQLTTKDIYAIIDKMGPSCLSVVK